MELFSSARLTVEKEEEKKWKENISEEAVSQKNKIQAKLELHF